MPCTGVCGAEAATPKGEGVRNRAEPRRRQGIGCNFFYRDLYLVTVSVALILYATPPRGEFFAFKTPSPL